MRRLISRIIPLLCLPACHRAPAATVDAGPPPVAVVADAAADAAPPAPAPAKGCAVVNDATIDDGFGTKDGEEYRTLGDVRVLADDASTLVTWTRTDHYSQGDGGEVPLGAQRRGAGAFTQVVFPDFASACSIYGAASPNTAAMPFVVWGAFNHYAFEQFVTVPKLAEGAQSATPDRTVATKNQTLDTFVASHDVALSALSESQCSEGCNCPPGKDALWLQSLDPKKPFGTRVATGKFNSLAFTLTDNGGIAAWRAGKPPSEQLFYLRVGADGKPNGAPVSFAKGDVGAPAVAMSGNDAFLVWASRADKKSPYALSMMKVGSAPSPVPTSGSAFAPAILVDGSNMLLAWMEGDLTKTGEIHVVRAPLAGPMGPSAVVSGAEADARDPELSGTIAHPTLVWSTFPKEKPAGVIRVGSLSCGSGS